MINTSSITKIRVVLLLLSLVFSNVSVADEPVLGARFFPLGDLPGGEFFSSAHDVSSDGKTVVGHSKTERFLEAVVWTEEFGSVSLGSVNGATRTSATGVSSDGSVVVGVGGLPNSSASLSLFRWTAEEGITELSGCGCDYPKFGAAVSGDGKTIISTRATTIEGHKRSIAFRWNAETGPINLGYFPGGGTYSNPIDLTPDGHTIVGLGSTPDGSRGFKWTEQTGLIELGTLMHSAYAVSADGSAIAGLGFQNGQGAVRWTEEEGPVWLGHAPGIIGPTPGSTRGISSYAADISADGSVIVGGSSAVYTASAFRWTERAGMRSVGNLLEELGVDITGWTLEAARGVSADGSVIVGTGINPFGATEGWVATIPPNYVPEPHSIISMSLAICVLLCRRAN